MVQHACMNTYTEPSSSSMDGHDLTSH